MCLSRALNLRHAEAWRAMQPTAARFLALMKEVLA